MEEKESAAKKYWAFISYSHADQEWADWLHRGLERYVIPKDLVRRPTPTGDLLPKRLVPVFRDREELPSAADLGNVILRALEQTRYLVVICSPRSARSVWVEQEIVQFKRMHGENRVFCLIVDGEPWASDGKAGWKEEDECFSRAIRHRLGSDGEISALRTEPIAADAREGKDGKENALTKLMAGLIGVGFDDLRRRDEQYQRERIRRLRGLVALFALLFVMAVAAGVYAAVQKREVQRTLSRADLQLALEAEKKLDHSRAAAYLGRSLRLDRKHRSAAVTSYGHLVYKMHHPPVGPVMRHPKPVTDLAGVDGGTAVMVLSGDSVYRWKCPEGKLEAVRNPDGSEVTCLSVKEGEVWVGTRAGKVHRLNLRTLEPTGSAWEPKIGGIVSLAWSADGRELSVGGDPKGSVAWGWKRFGTEGEELQVEYGEGLETERAVWSPGGRWLVLYGASPNFLVWDRRSGLLTRHATKLAVTSVWFDGEDRIKIVDIFQGLMSWNLEAGKEEGNPIGLRPLCARSALAPDGSFFAGANRVGEAYLYETASGKIFSEPIAPGFAVTRLAFLDGRHLVVAGENGMAQVRRIRPVAEALLTQHFAESMADLVAIHPDGTMLAATYRSEPRVRFYDSRTLEIKARTVVFPEKLRSMSFSADGERLLGFGFDGRLHWMEWKKGLESGVVGEPLAEVSDSSLTLEISKFSSDRQKLAIQLRKGVKLVKAESGETERVIGENARVAGFDWSEDGRRMALVSEGQKLSVVDADSGEERLEIALNAPGMSVDWSTGDLYLAVLTTDGVAYVYDSKTGDLKGSPTPVGSGASEVQWLRGQDLLAHFDVDGNGALSDPWTGMELVRLPRLGELSSGTWMLPGRDEFLISMDSQIALVPCPQRGVPPMWWPSVLEGLGGLRLNPKGSAEMVDPDAWMRAKSTDASSWAKVRDWLYATEESRPIYPGAAVDTLTVIERNRSAERERKEWSRIYKQMKEDWQSGDESRMQAAHEACTELLGIQPNSTGTWRIAAQMSRVLQIEDLEKIAWRGMIESLDSTLLEETEAMLELVRIAAKHEDRQEMNLLLEKILEVIPDQTEALEWKEILEETEGR